MKQNLKQYFKSRKGQIVSLVTEKQLKLRKGIEGNLTKLSKFQARAGVNYDNIQNVKEARESGNLPSQNMGLPWGEWDEFPYTIRHKGSLYYRFSALHNKNSPKSVSYLWNGQEISEEEAKAIALASEFKPSKSEVFNLKEENIREIN